MLFGAAIVSDPVAGQPPPADESGEADIEPTPEERSRLAELGWPPEPPIARAPDHDLLQRRGGAPVSGALRSLHAFALVATPSGDVRVPREEIGFVLLNGELIPPGVPLLPLAEDAVVLTDGRTVLTGRVEVEGEAINVAGRTVRQADAALIRLLDPAAEDAAAAAEEAGGSTTPPDGSDGSGAGAPPAVPPDGAGPSPNAPAFPGGEPGALWTGTIEGRYSVQYPDNTYSHTFTIRLRLREIRYLGGAAAPMETIPLQIEQAEFAESYSSVEPNGDQCSGLGQVQGSFSPIIGSLIVKRQNVDVTPYLGYDLPLNRGMYSLGPLPPAASYRAPCDSPDNWIEVHFIGSSILVGRSPNVPWTSTNLSDPEVRYVEDGKMQGNYETTADTFHHTVVSWSLCREDADCPPPPEALPDDSPLPPRDPCAAPRALISHAQAERQRALDRLNQISEEFVPLAAREATQRRTKDQLQGAFDKMLYAAMIADASTQLLEYATSSSMLKGAAATGKITAAQLRFMTRLDDAIEFYQEWLQFIDDPGGWGASKLFGGGQDVVFGEDNRLGDFALDMVAYGQLLGSLVGLDDGSQALAYIETNLARFGPLIPEYSINKARQYVEVSRAWADTIRTMSRLTTEAGRLTFDAEEMALNIAVSENRLEGC